MPFLVAIAARDKPGVDAATRPKLFFTARVEAFVAHRIIPSHGTNGTTHAMTDRLQARPP